MAIKAGRVGVAPNQVDEFGNINSEATSGYTKQEADTKFETQSHAASTYETQSHAASTYETKSDAATLQPKTLLVPIEMLSGTKLTVESALQGLNSDKTDKNGWSTPETLTIPDDPGLGVLKFSENVQLHLACFWWTGNSNVSASQNLVVQISDVMTEKPIGDMVVPIKNGVTIGVTFYGNNNILVGVVLGASAWSYGSIIVPTTQK